MFFSVNNVTMRNIHSVPTNTFHFLLIIVFLLNLGWFLVRLARARPLAFSMGFTIHVLLILSLERHSNGFKFFDVNMVIPHWVDLVQCVLMKWNASWCLAVLLHAGEKIITAIKLNNDFRTFTGKTLGPYSHSMDQFYVHRCYRRVDMYLFLFRLKDTLCILLAKCIECEFWDAFMLLLRCFGFYRRCFVAFHWLSITKVNLDKKISLWYFIFLCGHTSKTTVLPNESDWAEILKGFRLTCFVS